MADRRSAPRRWGRRGRLLSSATAIVLVAACGSTSPRQTIATLTGTVYSAPSCPVERSDSTCPPRAVDGASVEALRGETVQAQTHTDRAGRFRLVLPYGQYTIRASNVGALRTTATEVVEINSATPPVRLTVDSGIR